MEEARLNIHEIVTDRCSCTAGGSQKLYLYPCCDSTGYMFDPDIDEYEPYVGLSLEYGDMDPTVGCGEEEQEYIKFIESLGYSVDLYKFLLEDPYYFKDENISQLQSIYCLRLARINTATRLIQEGKILPEHLTGHEAIVT